MAPAALALAFAVAMGCGSDKKLPPGSDVSGGPSPSGGGSGAFGGGDDGGAPLCEKNPDGTICDCVEVPMFADPPNMYFVLDRSGSMSDFVDDSGYDKWDLVRITVASILRSLGPRANFGATVFPGYGGDSCALPAEILATSPGDPPGQGDGPLTTRLLAATAYAPEGGTPTAEALRSILPKLKALDEARPGKSFVILATDGGPNCGKAACGFDRCQPNIDNFPGCPVAGPTNCCEAPLGSPASCLDDIETVAAAKALADAGFPVYVVGISGSAAYSAVLDNLAVAGTTALPTSPKYYAANATATGTQTVVSTLKKVAAKIVASCSQKLTTAPQDPSRVNVYLDDVVLPREPINGWKIDGDTVTLLGSSCQKVLDGEVLGIRIVTGCPTVVPK